MYCWPAKLHKWLKILARQKPALKVSFFQKNASQPLRERERLARKYWPRQNTPPVRNFPLTWNQNTWLVLSSRIAVENSLKEINLRTKEKKLYIITSAVFSISDGFSLTKAISSFDTFRLRVAILISLAFLQRS